MLTCSMTPAEEMFSNSAKHLFGIYMLFVIILYLCIFNNVIYMLFYILHEITLPIKKYTCLHKNTYPDRNHICT